jgi:hypothetical protein
VFTSIKKENLEIGPGDKVIVLPNSESANTLKKTKDTNERMFVKQVFYGVLRYKEFLKAFTDNLFNMNKASTERKDQTLYSIICYITVFRLDELSQDDYKNIIYSQDYVKMNEFFNFIFNIEILEDVLRPEWIKIYDYKYVDGTILPSLTKNSELFSDLISNINTKASGFANQNSQKLKIKKETTEENEETDEEKTEENQKIKKPKIITVPEPFNLTKPKPKIFKLPIEMSSQFKCESTLKSKEYYNQVTLDKIESQRKERLENIKNTVNKKYIENKPFDLETMKRPTNLQKIAEEVNSKRNFELQFNNKYVNEPKDFSKNPANIKYNETAILREELHIQKENTKEEIRLMNLLIDKSDTREFERWKREMEMQDDKIKAENILKRMSKN